MKQLFIILLFATLHHTADSQILYVHKQASGINDGSSWANAYTTLQAAIEEANTNTAIQEIQVAGGVYQEMELTIAQAYTLRGSFNPMDNKQYYSTHPSTVEPHTPNTSLLVTPAGTLGKLAVEGFHFNNGTITNNMDLTLLNCRFTASPISNTYSFKAVNCFFFNPFGSNEYNFTQTVNLFVTELYTRFINCTFINHGYLGTNIQNTLGNLTISNCILTSLYLPEIINIFGITTLDHNIVQGAIVGNVTYKTDSATVDARFVDPLFADTAAGNFQLRYGSPAINSGSNALYEDADDNSGNNSISADLDLAGNNRVNKSTIDLGAFERNALQQTISIADASATYGDVIAPALITNNSMPVHYTSSDAAIAAIITEGGQQKISANKVGQTSITVTQDTDENLYDPANPVSFNVTVLPKHITVTSAHSKVYGDADPALTYTATPALVAGDAFTGQLSRAPGENAGEYEIGQNTLALSNNYQLNFLGGQFTIQKRPVTVTSQANNKTYGESDPPLTYTIAPALLGTDVLTGDLSRLQGEDVGEYAITQGSLNNSNYDIQFIPSIFSIGKAPQQITWNQSLIVGCDNNTTVTLTGFSSSGLPLQYHAANTSIATINGNQLTIGAGGITTITATQPGNQNYLPATSVEQSLTAKIPAHLLVKHWNDVLMFDNSSKAYTSWQWYKNGDPVNGATGQYYYESGNLNGTYHATVKNTAGETFTTCPLIVTPGPSAAAITVFPNPATKGQSITVKTNYTAAQLQGATLVITSHAGIIIARQQNPAPQITLPMSFIPGLYVVRLTLSSGITHATNLIIQP